MVNLKVRSLMTIQLAILRERNKDLFNKKDKSLEEVFEWGITGAACDTLRSILAAIDGDQTLLRNLSQKFSEVMSCQRLTMTLR